MCLQCKNKDLLKIQTFYSEEIKSVKKKKRETTTFIKKPKELTIKQLSDVLAFPPKIKKRSKRLTKYQILSNILSFFISAGISRKQYAFRNYAGTYNVEVMDTKSLDDPLFSAKRSINDFFKDLLEEKKVLNTFYLQELLLKNGIIQLILTILTQFIAILTQ